MKAREEREKKKLGFVVWLPHNYIWHILPISLCVLGGRQRVAPRRFEGIAEGQTKIQSCTHTRHERLHTNNSLAVFLCDDHGLCMLVSHKLIIIYAMYIVYGIHPYTCEWDTRAPATIWKWRWQRPPIDNQTHLFAYIRIKYTFYICRIQIVAQAMRYGAKSLSYMQTNHRFGFLLSLFPSVLWLSSYIRHVFSLTIMATNINVPRYTVIRL